MISKIQVRDSFIFGKAKNDEELDKLMGEAGSTPFFLEMYFEFWSGKQILWRPWPGIPYFRVPAAICGPVYPFVRFN